MPGFLKLLLSVLLAVTAAGAFNYHRNAGLDAVDGKRPLAGLDNHEIDLLEEAYRSEIAELKHELAKAAGSADRADDYAASDVQGRTEGFERFQVVNEQYRELDRRRLEREVEIEKLERERAIRARGPDSSWSRVWRRVTTL